MKKEIVVVGAGVAGIATALRLTAKGYKVRVYEANAYLMANYGFSKGEYRFDAGPSLFTMPHFIDELFTLFKETHAIISITLENPLLANTLEDGVNLMLMQIHLLIWRKSKIILAFQNSSCKTI